MREISIDEAKVILLDILDDIHEFCAEHDLHYALAGGAMIGAIRHGGFIPWDDDIDIFLPRSDYNILLEEYNKEGKNYVLHSLNNDSDYCYPFAKVEDSRTLIVENVVGKKMGISIDVFPVDNMEDTYEKSVELVKKISFVRNLYKSKLIKPGKNNSFTKKLLIIILKAVVAFIPLRALAEKLSDCCMQGTTNSNFVGNLSWGYGVKEILPRKVIQSYMEIPFEDRHFMAFKEYDLYLRTVFGDYMQLPPEDKRHSPHTLNGIFWK